jgi:hypothetical protein
MQLKRRSRHRRGLLSARLRWYGTSLICVILEEILQELRKVHKAKKKSEHTRPFHHRIISTSDWGVPELETEPYSNEHAVIYEISRPIS